MDRAEKDCDDDTEIEDKSNRSSYNNPRILCGYSMIRNVIYSNLQGMSPYTFSAMRTRVTAIQNRFKNIWFL